MAEKSDEIEQTTVEETSVELSDEQATELDGMGQGAEGDEDPTGAETVADDEETTDETEEAE